MNPRKKTLRRAALVAAIPLLFATALIAQDEDPPARVARIAYVQGVVSFQPGGSDNWNQTPPNYPMTGGDRVYTDQSARAIIQNGSTDVRLWGQTDVTLTNLTDQYEQLGLAQGALRVRVFGINQGSTIEVDTPNASIFIQQPGDYRINAYDQQASLLEVNVGSAQITGPGINQEVDQGQAVQVAGSNPVELGLVTMPPFDDLDRWSIDRDHHVLNSVSARYVSREIPGYDDLDDYGDWTPTTDYGPVWYPRAMPAGWQPYTMGHWAYVNPWGYTWVDDEPWGYAPFHYGRWAVVGGRWGWVPGPPAVAPVYSPALVAFVGSPGGVSVGINIGGGGGVAAWFPLGVAEPYVPWYRCTPNYVRNVNVTNVNVTVIKNVTVVNNYNTFINNTRTVTNVNEIHVTNVNYVNRTHVYAVPANAMASGAHVQQAAVRLNEQQRQQLASAPVVVARPPAPQPTRSVLQPRQNVARPAVRPALMTPHGVAPATPAANKPNLRPVSLPKPQPAAAIKPAVKPVAPNLKPAVATTNRPVTPTQPGNPAPPANNVRPTPTTPETRPTEPSKPASPANNARPAPTMPESRPTEPGKPGPPANNVRPVPTAPETRPTTPPTQPGRPTPPANNVRPAPTTPETRPTPPPNNARPMPPSSNPRPAPENRPAEPNQPGKPIPPANSVRLTPTTPETRPAPPANPAPPPNNTRPAQPPNNAHPAPQNRPAQPAQPTRPEPPQAHPQQPPRPEAQPVHPAPQQQAHPQEKVPPNQQKPEEKKRPEDEKKPE